MSTAKILNSFLKRIALENEFIDFITTSAPRTRVDLA